jgi:hypothetical protein
MKSIKFRKIIITRKYKKKKYHGSRQRTRRIKMKKSQNKSKTNSKTTLKTIPKINKKKNYQKGGAEPTEEEKQNFVDSIVKCIAIKPSDYSKLIKILSEEKNGALFNIILSSKDSQTGFPLLLYLMHALSHPTSDSNTLLDRVVNIFIEKKANINIKFDDDSEKPRLVVKNANILYYEVAATQRSYFINLLIGSGADPNMHVITIQNDESSNSIIATLDASVFTHCCRELCTILMNKNKYKYDNEQISKIFECFKTLLNNSKVDINDKGVSRSRETSLITNEVVALYYPIVAVQFDIFKMILNNNRLEPNVDILDHDLLQLGRKIYRINIINYCITHKLFDFAKELVQNDKFNMNIETTDPYDDTKNNSYYSPLTLLIQYMNQMIQINDSELLLKLNELLDVCSEYSSKVDVNYRPNENKNTPLMFAILNTNEIQKKTSGSNPHHLLRSLSVIDKLFKFKNIDITLKNDTTGMNALDMTSNLQNGHLFEKILYNQVNLYINESKELKTTESLNKFDNLILGFKTYILNKSSVLDNNMEKLESNERYKIKYGDVITKFRRMLEGEINNNIIQKNNDNASLDDLVDFIGGPEAQVMPKKPKQKKNKNDKKFSDDIKRSETDVLPSPFALSSASPASASPAVTTSLPPPIQSKIQNKIIEQKMTDLQVESKVSEKKQIMQRQMKDQKKLEKQMLKQKCAEIEPYWLNVIVTTELIKEKEPLNITIYQYFDIFKNIVNELIRNEQFETFKTSMKELIPNFSVTAQSRYLYPNYVNQMSVFGVVVTFLSYILYQSQRCILYFKGGRSIQMYMENESNDFDFLILPYYNVDDNSSIPTEYTDAYSANPIVANKHREIALEVGKFILWIFKDTPQIQFSILDPPQTSSQNSIVKVSLITRPYPSSDRVYYIPFSDIGYGFEYYDNKIKRLFLSNVYGVNHTKMKTDTLMLSDSLRISFGLGVVFPSLEKLLYERLYYLYLYNYSGEKSTTSASEADVYYVDKKLIPQLIKLLNKISVDDPTFKSKLNNFIGKYIVSSDNSSKNNEFIVYVNDIFDNPLKYFIGNS